MSNTSSFHTNTSLFHSIESNFRKFGVVTQAPEIIATNIRDQQYQAYYLEKQRKLIYINPINKSINISDRSKEILDFVKRQCIKNPQQICSDDEKEIFVYDDRRILVFDINLNYLREFDVSSLPIPSHMTIDVYDENKRLYMTHNRPLNRVSILNSKTGKIFKVLDIQNKPEYIACSKRKIFFTENVNNDNELRYVSVIEKKNYNLETRITLNCLNYKGLFIDQFENILTVAYDENKFYLFIYDQAGFILKKIAMIELGEESDFISIKSNSILTIQNDSIKIIKFD